MTSIQEAKLPVAQGGDSETSALVGDAGRRDRRTTRTGAEISKRQSLAAFAGDMRSGELNSGCRWFAAKAAIFGGLGGLHVGWDIGAVASVVLQLTQRFNLTNEQKELVASSMLMGAVFGSVLNGAVLQIADRYGRRFAILATAVVFGISSAVSASAQNLATIYAGRVGLGLGVSVAMSADVLYLTEVAPPEWRGALVSCNELMTTLGIVLAYVTGLLTRDMADGWRIVFGAPVLLALLQFLGMLTMPRSPRWLLQHDAKDEAREAMRLVFGGDEARAERELSNAQEELAAFRRVQSANEGGETATLWRYNAPELMIAVAVMVFQQLVGNANVMNYAPIILTNAGMGDQAALLSTIGLGSLKVLMTILAILQLETMGRRPLLLCGSVLCAVAMAMLGAAFTPVPALASLAVAGLVLFVGAWSASFGPLGWLLASELFPDGTRGRAMTMVSTINWIANLVVSLTFLTLADAMGQANAFFLYAGVSAVAVAVVALYVPETQGRNLGAIRASVREGPLCCSPDTDHADSGDEDDEFDTEGGVGEDRSVNPLFARTSIVHRRVTGTMQLG